MDRIAAVCLYRQNLIQSATMIAESEITQFGVRFDTARDACVAALYASHIVCTGAISRRVSFCINQVVFAEAMKLACHFVFDVWIPPWTKIPNMKDCPDLRRYMEKVNKNRLKALNKLSFGQICLETNAVYKLCTAACLPDVCPRVVDIQGHFACKVLGYILTQIHEQCLKTSVKNGHLCISGIDAMFFSETEIKGGNDAAQEMLMMCSTCKVPAREGKTPKMKNYKLCTYRHATNHNAPHIRRGQSSARKKVGSVTVPLEAVYDILAIYAPDAHSGFWSKFGVAMVEAYDEGHFEDVNAFGQCSSESDDKQTPTPRLTFTLDFSEDPDKIHLRVNRHNHGHLFELEEDWEWKDAADVFNKIHGADVFSVDMLKRDYAATMMVAKGEVFTARPQRSLNLSAMIRALRESNGRAALAVRRGLTDGSGTQEPQAQSRPPRELPKTGSQTGKRANAQKSRDSVDTQRLKKRKRAKLATAKPDD
ncbi:hypothetical protein DPEC_G00067990 [Dallia pectoralis]|uniref:Uncharacterized protein n=1 Tax=Dallia pectoralis TaxID=75939 RepID=A0ACC2H1U0_DALPE|nr:hypothetical protein DPEC_G00067990 [Dallia pectoralis]